VNGELARLLLEDPEAARSDMGVRLFEELVELRDLNERRELEVQLQPKDLLGQACSPPPGRPTDGGHLNLPGFGSGR
jgi:hypothetical protein